MLFVRVRWAAEQEGGKRKLNLGVFWTPPLLLLPPLPTPQLSPMYLDSSSQYNILSFTPAPLLKRGSLN